MGRHSPDTDQRKSETARKAKKRKREEAVLDLPDGITADLPSISIANIDKTDGKTEERRKKKKKDKAEALSNGRMDDEAAEDTDQGGNGKKRRNHSRKETDKSLETSIPHGVSIRKTKNGKTTSKSSTIDPTPEMTEKLEDSPYQEIESPAGKKSEKKKADRTTKPAKDGHVADEEEKSKNNGPTGNPQQSDRFIVFIGNLPFTANKTSIEKHFESVKPDAVRHITHKDYPSKSKGYAFIEFTAYDRMKTCLKLYHHSQFEDGLSAGRKINVELTAGGGGSKSKDRKSKIKVKNEKLNEERKRRLVEEDKVRRSSERKDDGVTDDNEELHNGIHPSRRSRVPLR